MWNRSKELKNIISFQMINYYHLNSTGLDYISIFMVPVRRKLYFRHSKIKISGNRKHPRHIKIDFLYHLDGNAISAR